MSEISITQMNGAGRWANGVAWAVVIVLAVVYAVFGLTWAIAGEDAVSDTVVGQVAGFALLGGLGASLVAFVVALTERVRRPDHPTLRVPLAVFPALVAIVTVFEAFVIE